MHLSSPIIHIALVLTKLFQIHKIDSLQISEGNQFYEFEITSLEPKQYELLVKIDAISINPVDTKIRQSPVDNAPRVINRINANCIYLHQ